MLIIYLRTSTEEQNPENQLKDCLSINKWGEYELIQEQQSAFKDNSREKFEDIIKLIKQRKVDCLIVWDLDRLYRNRKKLIEFFQFCKLYGCKIYSYRQSFLETINTLPEPFNEAMYDFMLHMMGWMAEDESQKKGQRVKSAVRKRQDGTFSYKGNKWGRKSISTYKRNLIQKLRQEGKSIRTIAKEVNLSSGAVHKTLIESKEKTYSQESVKKLLN